MNAQHPDAGAYQSGDPRRYASGEQQPTGADPHRIGGGAEDPRAGRPAADFGGPAGGHPGPGAYAGHGRPDPAVSQGGGAPFDARYASSGPGAPGMIDPNAAASAAPRGQGMPDMPVPPSAGSNGAPQSGRRAAGTPPQGQPNPHQGQPYDPNAKPPVDERVPGQSGARATTAERRAAGESLGDMVGALMGEVSTLVRQEIALAKAELTQSAKRAGQGAGMLTGAAIAGWFVLLFLSVALWWALGTLIGNGWSALIVAVIWAIIALVLALVGRSRLKAVQGAPQTAQTLQEIPPTIDPRKDTP